MNVNEIAELCKESSWLFIKEKVPKEAPFFDVVWSVIRQRIFPKGQILPPEQWQFKASQADVTEGLGFHGGEDLQTTSMVCTLSALMIAITSSENRSKKVLDEFAAKYAAEFSTPQWAIPHIKSLVQKRLQELPASLSHKKVYAKPYLIWETGKPRRDGTKEDVESLREAAIKIKGKFDVYANDTEGGELLVFGERSKLDVGETFAWATLIALLERVGSRWTMQELFERIRPDEVYKRRPHSAHAYQWVRHVKESMKEDISRTSKPGTEKIVDSWFQTGERNRVNITTNLKACLVRKNPTAGS